ncbi:LAME_0B01706g1_1 [Lachancea meyersii CBS 8951]|uniref:LAME_0B01706g1_1 n=1 Tax=Lachancea meyersii CBS 8951 TaxID=1266667 RepID=A0A1G4ITW1_9SACH|nr:LAME_0B01706g1_1 [Lachancea meyersii CBS 8951]
MYIKAATSASNSTPRGTGFLDHYDVKLIKCRAVALRLQEFLRILKILNSTAKRRSEARFIIPLTNYILALYGAPTLNISEHLHKKVLAISEFKNVPVPDSIPAYDPGLLDIRIELAAVESDRENFKKNVYNAGLQGKILETAIKVTMIALQLAERNCGDSMTERNVKRLPDISGRPSELDETTFDELIQPAEVAMALDLAVLIKNFDTDTSDVSFEKLNLQVLTKFKDHMNGKVLRPIKSYHTSLFRFSKASSISQAKIIMNLPHWQYTMHRIYALLLRILYILTITKAFLRQIYVPNKQVLEAYKTRLRSANVYEFQELLQNLERICLDESDLDPLVESANLYGQSGSVFGVQPTNISQCFENDITPAIRKLRFYFQIMETWILTWRAIQENKSAAEKLEGLSESELSKLLEERMTNDKLEYIVRKNNESAAKSETEQSLSMKTPTKPTPMKTIFKRSSLQRSSLSPIASETSSSGSPPSRGLSRSPSLKNKKPPANKVSRNGSNVSSPLVSRRGSIAENEGATTNKRTTRPKPSTGAKLGDSSTDAASKVSGRRRSASLQSSVQSPVDANHIALPADYQRSNSLQASASFNQRMIRNTFAQVSGNLMGSSYASQLAPPAESPSPVQKSVKMLRSASASPPSGNSSPSKKKSTNHDCDELPNIESLIFDEEKLALVSKPNSNSSSTVSTESQQTEIVADGGEGEDLPEDSENHGADAALDVSVKKVRFTGVPPISVNEDPRPKRRGWYKKPAVLHYPPPPPQFAIQKYTLRQEGAAFHNSIRERDFDSNGPTQKRSSVIMQTDMTGTTGHKLASKWRDKLIR